MRHRRGRLPGQDAVPGDTGDDYTSLDGTLDEVAVYASALTGERVAAHHSRPHRRSGRLRRRSRHRRPVGWWRLDEPADATTLTDATGNDHSATVVGTVTLGAAGVHPAPTPPPTAGTAAGTAAVRVPGGDGNGIQVADADALDPGDGDFSWEAWVNTTAHGERVILGKNNLTVPTVTLSVTDDSGYQGRLRFRVASGESNPPKAYGPPVRVDDGAWHHVVVAVDRDAGVTIFVDGQSQFTAHQYPTLANRAPLTIGDAGDDYPSLDSTLAR